MNGYGNSKGRKLTWVGLGLLATALGLLPACGTSTTTPPSDICLDLQAELAQLNDQLAAAPEDNALVCQALDVYLQLFDTGCLTDGTITREDVVAQQQERNCPTDTTE